ncbi:uncharacterized protein LOC143191292 isoform X1 [Rhynchophorus ferrugineus]|uniref:uncharacterized protein LOC143191292 isoform X1 n=1 Tax=Rhynchophorus ferrugineus TaxID=354439 RepID=UPI003FCCB065
MGCNVSSSVSALEEKGMRFRELPEIFYEAVDQLENLRCWKRAEDLKADIKTLTATITEFMKFQKEPIERKTAAATETQITLVGKRKRGLITPPQQSQLRKANKAK